MSSRYRDRSRSASPQRKGHQRTRDDDEKSKSEKKQKNKNHKSHHSDTIHPDEREFEISEDDYYAKSTEFRVWLREEKDLFFDELDSGETRRYFKKFVRAWNKSKLDKKYYVGIRSSQILSAETTRYRWKIKNVDVDQVETIKNSVDRQTNVRFASEVRLRIGDTEQKETKPRVIGPAMLPPSKTAELEEMDEEDRQRYERSLRKKDRKEHQKFQDVVLEELAPKATGRDAMIEKKRTRNAEYRRETSPDVELDDNELLGGGDFSARLAARDRAREAREEKKNKMKIEKAANLREKATAFQSKEQQTLEMFKKMAEEQRKSGGGLWSSRNS